MSVRIRAALLLGLSALAAYSAERAVASVRPAWEAMLPQELYADFQTRSERAAYILRQRDGRIVVFTAGKERSPERTTDIEVEGLRHADRALLEKGIPAADRRELLLLLEDLGS